MALFVGKADKFILNGGAIARSCAVNFTGIHGAPRQVVQDHTVCVGIGINDVTGDLFGPVQIVRSGAGTVGDRVCFSRLNFQLGKINACAVDARRGPGFEATKGNSFLYQ